MYSMEFKFSFRVLQLLLEDASLYTLLNSSSLIVIVNRDFEYRYCHYTEAMSSFIEWKSVRSFSSHLFVDLASLGSMFR